MATNTLHTAVLTLIEFYVAQHKHSAEAAQSFNRHDLATFVAGLLEEDDLPTAPQAAIHTLVDAQEREQAPLQELIFLALFDLRRQLRVRRNIEQPDIYMLEA